MPISHQPPDSLPDLVTISNSNSESDSFSFVPHNCTAAMSAVATTLLKKDSTAVYIGEQGKLPIVTAGKLTPDLLFDFENGAFSYFAYKDLPEEKKVSHVAGGLQDG